MTTCLPCCVTVLVVMAVCLGTSSVHAWDAPPDAGVHYLKKHLKDAKGQLTRVEDVPGRRKHDSVNTRESIILEESNLETEIVLEEDVRPFMPVTFMSVPLDYFRQMVDQAQSYYDVLRVFLGQEYSDGQIDRIMTTNKYGSFSNHFIGGANRIKDVTIEDFKLWEKTNSETKLHGQCGQPVAELVRIRDLTHRGDVEYTPSCVVRYRCRDDSGCCVNGYRCEAKTSVNITKSILVGRLDTEKENVEDIRVNHFQIPNDTECECRKIPAPKVRSCPYPFNYSLHDCRCLNKALAQHCKRIAYGRESLERTQIRCVQENRCRPLDESVCPNFDIKEGKCPRRERVKGG